jgi:hypothetical protein
MPHGYSVRQASNEQEVYQALVAATKGYGKVIRFAKQVGVDRNYIHGMIAGNRRVSVEVARWLGYELRWVKKGAERDARSRQDRGIGQ